MCPEEKHNNKSLLVCFPWKIIFKAAAIQMFPSPHVWALEQHKALNSKSTGSPVSEGVSRGSSYKDERKMGI